jgi:hypothetical protein
LNLFEAAHNLSPVQRKRIVIGASILSALLTAAVLFGAFHFAALIVPAESPVWEAALQLRMILVRLLVAPVIAILGLCVGCGAFLVLGKTELYRRLGTWSENDPVDIRREKTRNAGNIFVGLLVASVLGMMFGVLR